MKKHPDCEISGCLRQTQAASGGYCEPHRNQIARGRDPHLFTPPTVDPCSHPGCEREGLAKGMCRSHYNAKKYSGMDEVQRAARLGVVIKEGSNICIFPDCSSLTDWLLCFEHGKSAKAHRLSDDQIRDFYTDPRCHVCDARGLRMVIDHDHSCHLNKACEKCARGMLCDGCNHALGIVKDDAKRLRGLADYLEAYERRKLSRMEIA